MLAAAFRAAPGNVSVVLLQQHDAQSSFMAIGVWNCAEDPELYDQRGQAAHMVGKLRFAFAGPPTLTTYEASGVS